MYYKFISAGVPVPWAYCITPLGRTWKPEGAYFSLKLLIINSELCDSLFTYEFCYQFSLFFHEAPETAIGRKVILSLSFSASETLSGSSPGTETESSRLHTQAGVCLPGRSYCHLNSLRAGILLCRHVPRISCRGLSYSARLGVSKCEHRTSVLIFAFMGTGLSQSKKKH